FLVNRPKKNWLRLVFCCKICCTYITHMYLGDHYPDSIAVVCWVRYCNFPLFGPTFKKFYQDLT
ncbi:hypothetical protein L208DRAFT_1562011, partial [Tricholoma matsutake]